MASEKQAIKSKSAKAGATKTPINMRDFEPVQQFFEKMRADLQINREKFDGLKTAQIYAEQMDKLIALIYSEQKNLPFTIIATGGYGRGRLARFSDIDLLFVTGQKNCPFETSALIERALYLLWDLHIVLGHNIGTAKQLVQTACEDIPLATSLIDIRYLLGSEKIYQDFLKIRKEDMARLLPRQKFIDAKIQETKTRHQKHGASRYMLEPNIKEGRGGLRDLDLLHWLCGYRPDKGMIYDAGGLKEILGVRLYHNYQRLEKFLWDVRMAIHDVAGRKDENLILDIQPDIAARLGYRAGQKKIEKTVERFMRHYFLNMRKVGFLSKTVTAAIEIEATEKIFAITDKAWADMESFKQKGRFLRVESEGQLTRDPLNMFRIIMVAAQNRLTLHPQTLILLTKYRRNIIAYRMDTEANRLFLQILTLKKGVAWAMRRLNETGILENFIPEFRNIIAQMQFNRYHYYTTDAHTIHALDVISHIEAAEFKAQLPLASRLAREKKYRRSLLYTAIFLHDIGKGSGRDHSLVGEEIAYQLCPRLGFNPQQVEIIAWLVKHHLVMSNVAFKRDLYDYQTLIDFANLVGNVERLNLLLMLTVTDIRAVSHISWTNYKASLLRELYQKTFDILDDFKTPNAENYQGIYLERIIAKREKLRADFSKWDSGEDYLAGLPANYLHAHSHTEIIAHGRQVERLESEHKKWLVHLLPEADGVRIEFIAHWHKKSFTDFAAILAMVGCNTHRANLFRLGNIYVMASFHSPDFSMSQGSQKYLHKISENILGDNEAAYQNQMKEIDAKIEQKTVKRKKSSQKTKTHKMMAKDTRAQGTVNFYLNHSGLYSLVEVHGLDRQGLLYELSNVLSQANLQIFATKIATFGEKVTDVFYVKDEFGLKLENNDQLEMIKQEMLAVL